MQLQTDRRNGLLSTEDYKKALRCLQWTTTSNAEASSVKPPRRKRTKLSPGETNRRTSMRGITKWLFDVEITRPVTPLYRGTGDREKLVMTKFTTIANKCIDYMVNDEIVAAQKGRGALLKSIEELVINRRRNYRNSRKPPKNGRKPKKPMKSIYENMSEFLLYNSAGDCFSVPRPQPLPLSKDDVAPPYAITPAVTPPKSIAPSVTPPQVIAPTTTHGVYNV